ncbi:MAG: DUF3793 family protein [Lachnospiraceae bacterium]|nr:DUF3793 family protein [Lachnospiraceae bacterium]
MPLKRTSTYALIYIYRPEHLRKDLEDPKAKNILEKKGYNADKARKTFSRYKKCTDVYQRLNKDGKTLSQLTVMVKNAV